MSITIKMNQDNTGIQMSGTTAGRNKTQDTKTRSTVFAGDLMLGQGNQIEQKKQTARRQAMKLRKPLKRAKRSFRSNTV